MKLSENAVLKLDWVGVFGHSPESEVQALIDPHCAEEEVEEAGDRRAEEEDEGTGGGSDEVDGVARGRLPSEQ
eukprot:8602841-Pyramimonas_sp.AAC.1